MERDSASHWTVAVSLPCVSRRSYNEGGSEVEGLATTYRRFSDFFRLHRDGRTAYLRAAHCDIGSFVISMEDVKLSRKEGGNHGPLNEEHLLFRAPCPQALQNAPHGGQETEIGGRALKSLLQGKGHMPDAQPAQGTRCRAHGYHRKKQAMNPAPRALNLSVVYVTPGLYFRAMNPSDCR